MTWLIEDDAFANGDVLLPALKKLNKKYILWKDDFWTSKKYLDFPKDSVFHGSLQNAHKIKQEKIEILSLCAEKNFCYSYLYENYADYMLAKNVIFTTIRDLLSNVDMLDSLLSKTNKFFARPDSPLKEFSGRVLEGKNLSPAHFDYGFYHSNLDLKIVLAEYVDIQKEYRFVCVGDKIVTGCEYLACGRKGVVSVPANEAWQFAQKIADAKKQTDLAYIIDVCESDKEFFLVEMNPFSGADLYCCDAEKIILEIEKHEGKVHRQRV